MFSRIVYKQQMKLNYQTTFVLFLDINITYVYFNPRNDRGKMLFTHRTPHYSRNTLLVFLLNDVFKILPDDVLTDLLYIY